MKIQLNLAVGMILATLFAFTIIPNNVNAEQPAAEQYRQMFKSGNFYVEYQMFKRYGYESNKIVLAGKDGKRMARETGKKAMFSFPSISRTMGDYFVNSELSTAYNRNFLGGSTERITRLDTPSNKNYPDVLYSDGKYYRFIDYDMNGSTRFGGGFLGIGGGKNIKVIVLPEDQLNSPNLDEKEEWKFVREDLALPDELAIFYWDDPFRNDIFHLTMPRYNGESKVTFEKREYLCDQYLVDIKSLAGNIIAQEAYNMLYDNGQLKVIQKYLLRNGKEIWTRTTKISVMTSDVPESAFKIGKKVKVYAAQNGNMADLLEQKTLVETLGGK